VVGFVGGYGNGDREEAFLYSVSFVFGLSLTFAVLGTAAGLFGTLFGTSVGFVESFAQARGITHLSIRVWSRRCIWST
jgi:hypothetical protein